MSITRIEVETEEQLNKKMNAECDENCFTEIDYEEILTLKIYLSYHEHFPFPSVLSDIIVSYAQCPYLYFPILFDNIYEASEEKEAQKIVNVLQSGSYSNAPGSNCIEMIDDMHWVTSKRMNYCIKATIKKAISIEDQDCLLVQGYMKVDGEDIDSYVLDDDKIYNVNNRYVFQFASPVQTHSDQDLSLTAKTLASGTLFSIRKSIQTPVLVLDEKKSKRCKCVVL